MPFEGFILVGQRSRSCRLDKLSLVNRLVVSTVTKQSQILTLYQNNRILDLSRLKAIADDKLTFSQQQIFKICCWEKVNLSSAIAFSLDSFNLKESADDNFEFDEDGREYFIQVENTAGKGEIARNEQFLLFPSVLKRLILQTHKNQGLFGKGLNTELKN